MKNIDFNENEFRELTCDESFICKGGGFAYDVGRFLRFVIICGPGTAGIGNAIADAVVTQLTV